MRRTPIAHVVFPRPNRERPVSELAWDAARRVAEAPELEVEIIVPVPMARGLTRKDWPDDIEQILSNLDPRPTLVPYIPVPRRSIESAAASLSAHLVARRRARRPSVLHGSFLDEGGYAAVSAARALGISAIAVGHGSDVVVAREDGSRARRTRTTLHYAADLVCVSDALAAEIAHFGRTAEVVRYGTDETRFPVQAMPAGPPVVLFVGPFSRAKGADVVLDAIARTNLSLRMIGSPGDVDVRAQIAALGIGSRVEVLGEVAHDALYQHYAAASMVVLPSRTEGFGTVLVEAILTGRPIVTTAVTEIASVGVGRVVPAGDAEALARAVEAVYGARWKPEALRKQALPFTWSATGGRLVDITLNRIGG